MKQFLLYSFRLVLIVSLSLASVYEEGDTISVEHQNVIFEQCYGYDEDGEIKLASCPELDSKSECGFFCIFSGFGLVRSANL
jgi:hypothetical protein